METLSDALADIPDQALSERQVAGQRGRLLRPLQGKLRAAFAGKLPDGRPSSGWWIEALTGAEVQAVAHGRVVFADWMRGYGLMLIIDHGEGFMSVYAGGEALLVEPGDWVEAGVAVATAGQSGGFAESGVYFELRRQGKPLDPASWIKR
nr:peptidoglycan DD-metalloendopeptidase family protein [Pseudomarimonas arenosa]